MKHITLKPLLHRGKDCIGIYFAKDAALQSIIRKHTDARWSKTHTCWYVEDTAQNHSKLKAALNKALEIPGREVIHVVREIRATEGEKTRVGTAATHLPAKTEKALSKKGAASGIALPSGIIHNVNVRALLQFERELVLKAYSPNTIRTYKNEFAQFLVAINKHPTEAFTPDRLKDYLQYCSEKLNLSENTLHSRMNALKFYYEKVLGREKFFWAIPRPKKQLILPKVISKEQIASLINSIENKKHKTIIALAYACGLRVSEVVSLKISNIDGQRNMLFIERGKGKKDRVISLSPHILFMLRDYYRTYKPKFYLFEGQYENEHLSHRSIQAVMQRAKKKAGINQAGGMHMLRHSFATHLLDKGIDVVFIQKLLGHKDIKTTLKYLHVTNKDLTNILSPIEDIDDLLKK